MLSGVRVNKKHKDPAAVALGRRGGQAKVATKGFGSLSPEERAANASAAAAARWGKKRAKKKAAK